MHAVPMHACMHAAPMHATLPPGRMQSTASGASAHLVVADAHDNKVLAVVQHLYEAVCEVLPSLAVQRRHRVQAAVVVGISGCQFGQHPAHFVDRLLGARAVAGQHHVWKPAPPIEQLGHLCDGSQGVACMATQGLLRLEAGRQEL